MLSWYETYGNMTARHKDLLREAERERLAQAVRAGSACRPHLIGQMLSWVGQRLAAWGARLQQHTAAVEPLRSGLAPVLKSRQ
jgi:hypothetical protein